MLQTVAIGLYLLPLSGWPHIVAEIVMFAAVALALITGIDYVGRALKLRRARR
jgi:CDP-diacylglycerol--glycerol-3-phosphate 3-phosphatidyltransferase